MSNFKQLHEQIAAKLIAALQAGTSPFQKTWNNSDEPAFTIPVNPTTNNNYRGMNSLWLSMQGYQDPRWLTLKQASYEGFAVEKGAKATLISFVKKSNIEAIRDADGNKIADEQGKTITRTTQLDKPMIATAWVFNAQQISGMPLLADYLQQKQALQKWDPIERAESLIKQSGAAIDHGGNQAYYSKSEDRIQLPLPRQFDSASCYYAVALHELGHWTGHESRLKRQMDGPFGSQAYAREELRAEIASLMLGSEMKIGHQFGQHAAYVANWIKILQDDPYELFRASSDGQKIMDFLLEIERKRELQKEAAPDMSLGAGQEIGYNNQTYRILEKKGKSFQVEEVATGNKFRLSQKDGLYAKLIQARNNPLGQQPEPGEQISHKIGR